MLRQATQRGGAALLLRRLASTATDKKPLIETAMLPGGVLTLRFANDAVKGVVITGSGKYYSAGVDLSSLIQPMAPAKLVKQIRDQNEKCFGLFLDFPKPIVAAVNGPAIGAAVTSTILTDRVLANEAATFSLPFAKLGVPPEGCSSVTWPERMGQTNAQRMLGPENWIPTANEAFEAGLIDEVVPGDANALVARAVEVVRERIAAGGKRRFDAAEHARLSKVNAQESATLANAFVSAKFLSAMEAFNVKRKKSQLATFFWLAKVTPLQAIRDREKWLAVPGAACSLALRLACRLCRAVGTTPCRRVSIRVSVRRGSAGRLRDSSRSHTRVKLPARG